MPELRQPPQRGNPTGPATQLHTEVVREFAGINTQSFRTVIKNNEFSWLENVIPVGPGNLKIVQPKGPNFATLSEVCYAFYWANLNGVDYVFAFSQTGIGYMVKLSAPYTITQIGSVTFGLSGIFISQWKNDRILIADPANGLWSWDGAVLCGNQQAVTIDLSGSGDTGGSGYVVGDALALPGGTGSGATAKVTAIGSGGSITTAVITAGGSSLYTADYQSTVTGGSGTGAKLTVHVLLGPPNCSFISVYQSRVWVAYQRTISFSAPNAFYDFSGSSGGGSFIFYDPVLAGDVQQLIAANNFLYIYGSSSINAISDVRLVGSPATTVFANTVLTSSIGSTFPSSLLPFFRYSIFMTPYGVFSLFGATPSKISDGLDGIFESIDFTYNITAAVAVAYNSLMTLFMVRYTGTESINGEGPLILGYFAGKWLTFSQDTAMTAIFGAVISGVPTAYGTDGKNIYQLFSGSGTTNIKVQTKLYDFGAKLATIRSMRFGLEASGFSAGASIDVEVETENGSEQYTFNPSQIISWTNSSGDPIVWTNSVGSALDWYSSPSFGLVAQGSVSNSGKFLGATITSSSYPFSINGIDFEVDFGPQWGNP